MAITKSGLFVPTWIDILDNTQLAVNLSSSTMLKVAMYKNTITPNFSSDTAYTSAPYSVAVGHEVTGTGYTAGGNVLTNLSVSEGAAGSIKFTADPVVWSSSTISGAHGALLYAYNLAGQNALLFVDFGDDYSTVSNTFTIQWHSGGIFAMDLTP